jgi:hypothetical protein
MKNSLFAALYKGRSIEKLQLQRAGRNVYLYYKFAFLAPHHGMEQDQSLSWGRLRVANMVKASRSFKI